MSLWRSPEPPESVPRYPIRTQVFLRGEPVAAPLVPLHDVEQTGGVDAVQPDRRRRARRVTVEILGVVRHRDAVNSAHQHEENKILIEESEI